MSSRAFFGLGQSLEGIEAEADFTAHGAGHDSSAGVRLAIEEVDGAYVCPECGKHERVTSAR